MPVDQKMKIGLIPFGSDTNPYQELTRRALVAEGHDVRTFPKSNWLPLWRAARSGVEVLHLDWPHSFYRGAGTVQSAIKCRQFRWQLPRLGPVKVVWTVHNLQAHDSSGRPEPELDWLVQRADALVSLSHLGVELIQQRWPSAREKTIAVIPFGHYADWYDTSITQQAARKKLGVPPTARLAVCAGRLQPYKGIEALIPAYLEIARQDDWLLIAGAPASAAYAESLRRLTSSHQKIILVPRLLDRTEISCCMAAADFAVFPFKEILNSASVILALSFGKPVVAPAKGSLAEVIPAEAWFPTTEGSEQKLSTALSRAYQCSSLGPLGQIAKQKMIREHSWKTVGVKLSNLYRDIV